MVQAYASVYKGGGSVGRLLKYQRLKLVKTIDSGINRSQLASANGEGANDTINTCSPQWVLSLSFHPEQQMWMSDPTSTPSPKVSPLFLSCRTPHPTFTILEETETEKKTANQGAKEETEGVEPGWWWGRGLRFGCLTQKRLECKELIRSGSLSSANKGTGLQTKVEGGGVVGEGWGRLVAFLPSGAFVLRGAGGWRRVSWVAQRWRGGSASCPPQGANLPLPRLRSHPGRSLVYVLCGPDRCPSARSYYSGVCPL